MNIEELYSYYLSSRTVTTDSRAITPGCIFFALRGEHYDGNDFVDEALRRGAAVCVTSRQQPDDSHCMVVDDVLATLQDLARYHRSQLDIPVVGITGTNGKTTTKELITAVLSRRYRTHATAGNHNNHLGVPLTLLSAPADAEILVVEMGASHPGEIDMLCHIAQPTCGLITCVGKAHIEGFGSLAGVIQTKTELYRYLAQRPGGACAFVNRDDSVLMNQVQLLASLSEWASPLYCYQPHTAQFDWEHDGLSVMTYGTNRDASVTGSLCGSDPYLKFYFEDDDEVYNVQTHLVGAYNFDNAMAAVCVGRFFDVASFDIKEALTDYHPANHRSQYCQRGRTGLLLDCYNANPSSMKVAIDNFATMKAPHKMLVLGEMRELGSESMKEHQQLVRYVLAEPQFEAVILVGDAFRQCQSLFDERVVWFANVDDARRYLDTLPEPPDGRTLLLKGSNSNRLWTLAEQRDATTPQS